MTNSLLSGDSPLVPTTLERRIWCEMTFSLISRWLGVGGPLRDERAKATLVLQGSTAVRWNDEVSDH
jgi:hypothetical protein